MCRLLFIALFCFVGCSSSLAQWDDEETECVHVPEGKAMKWLQKGQNGSKYERSERVEFLEAAFEEDESCMVCLFEWGKLEFNSIKRSRGSFYPALVPLEILVDRCPYYSADAWYMLGAIAYADRDYAKALSSFTEYIRFPAASEEVLGKHRTKRMLEVEEVMPLISFYMDFQKNEGRYTPEPVQPVSTSTDEFLPALSPDGSMLFFTRRMRYKAKGDVVSTESEVFHVAEREPDEDFDAGIPLESPFNTGTRYGGASISVDNRELYIAAANPTSKYPDNIDLFFTSYKIIDRDDDGAFFYVWEPLVPLDAINTPDGWEAQPALSANGKELYFAGVNANSRTDQNGNPTMDIWWSIRNESGDWTTPTSLPSPVNSNFNDKAPFLHPDGHTLYFASDRTPSGGGYDIWMCKKDTSGAWGAAVNFGTPLNTEGDEHGLVVSTNGREAYFAGRRDGTKAMDIIRFQVPPEFKPENVFIVQGSLDDPDQEVPDGARLYLQYAQSKEVQEIEFDGRDGHFASVVRASSEEDVLLVAEADGIAFEAQVIYDHESSSPREDRVSTDIELAPSKDGEPFEIGDIQFGTNSSTINRTSELMLEIFAAYLLRNEAVGVRIKGHTDDRGNPEENQLLSEQRAQAVAQSLIGYGVASAQVTYEGLGQSNPIASNSTAEGRSLNRRTEFEIELKN
jgi:outer membrane protein OmpA-like peptidoglycan-associated protein